MQKYWRLLSFACLFLPSLARSELLKEFELGHQLADEFNSAVTTNRLYGIAHFRYDQELSKSSIDNFSLNFALRGWLASGNDSEATLRAASGAFITERLKIQLGFQEIPWGETFGVYIADIVNPHDLRDPLFNELSWIRLPVFALNTQIFLNSLTLQGIFTPFARNLLLPKQGSTFDVFTPQLPGAQLQDPSGASLSDFPAQSEYGGKANYLFDFGLDLAFLYYHHENRNPVYEIQSTAPKVIIAPVQLPIDTYGMTFSQALGSYVFRGDLIYNLNEPQGSSTLATHTLANEFQMILGSDVTYDTGWTIGAQYHLNSLPNDLKQWASFRVQKAILHDRVELSAFAFVGIDSTDLWIQPKVSWSIISSLNLSIRADILSNLSGLYGYESPGVLDLIQGKSRVFTWLSYKF